MTYHLRRFSRVYRRYGSGAGPRRPFHSPRLLDMDVRASIVIPTCNRIEELRALLHSCLNQTARVEIIVMDDAANDEVEEMIRVEFSGIRYYRLGKSKGPAFQRN